MKCLHETETGPWVIVLNAMEANLLTGLFRRMAEHYRLDVESLPEKLQEHWRGQISRAGDPKELKEAQEQLQEERLVWRGERLTLLEKWMEDYARNSEGKPWTLELAPDEFEGLLIVLNDRRLILAAQHGLDEEEMEANWEKAPDLTTRMVLGEIDILTQFLIVFLNALNSGLKIDPDEIL